MGATVTQRRWSWGAAGGLSLVVIGLAARFTPAGLPAASPAPGIQVDKGIIALAPGAPQWRFVRLGTVGAAGGRWTDPVPARISIDQTRASRVGAPLPGRVSRVFAEMGERVRAGDPLFSVASPDIAELLASREKAVVDLESARATLVRVRAVVASRAVPAKEELLATQQLKQAEVSLRFADAKLGSLKVASHGEGGFTVTAPRAGVVVEKNVLVDQQVSPDGSGVLMVVADLSSVWVVADLFEADAADIQKGASAQVTSPSLPDLKIDGTVDMVSSVVDPNRHTLPIRVGLANPAGLLHPNVYARVRFALSPRRAGTLEVSASALVSDGEHQYVYVQDPSGRFARREVTTGSVREGRVPVLSGLARGETVVEEGAILLDNQLSLGE